MFLNLFSIVKLNRLVSNEAPLCINAFKLASPANRSIRSLVSRSPHPILAEAEPIAPLSQLLISSDVGDQRPHSDPAVRCVRSPRRHRRPHKSLSPQPPAQPQQLPAVSSLPLSCHSSPLPKRARISPELLIMAHTPAGAAGDGIPSMSPRAHRQKNAMNGVHNDDHSVSAHASSGSSNPSSGSDASDAEMHAAADGQHTNGDAAAHPHRRHRIAKRSHNNTVATRPHLSRQDQEIVRIIGQQLNSLGLKLATFIAFVVIRTLILYILILAFSYHSLRVEYYQIGIVSYATLHY